MLKFGVPSVDPYLEDLLQHAVVLFAPRILVEICNTAASGTQPATASKAQLGH
jgi:hypothetical protein